MTTAYFDLATGSFTENWTDTSRITTTTANFTNVPSIEGYIATTGPAAGSSIANYTTDFNTASVVADAVSTSATGGVLEVQTGVALNSNPTIAVQGSNGTPLGGIVLFLNSTGRESLNLTLNLRDIDNTADNAAQQVNIQYRIGTTGTWTNIPGGYFADVTTVNGTPSTAVNLNLPAAAANQAQLQVRVFTLNATGNDELVGIDDIVVTSNAISPVLTAGNDTFTGGAANNTLNGLAGDDTLNGGAGNDLITGGAGADTLTGGTGVDIFYGDARGQGTDTITDFVVGTDQIRLLGSNASSVVEAGGNTTINYAGGSVILAGVTGFNAATIITSALRLTGADDTFAGSSENDLIYGNGGADVLTGGLGNDLLTGDAGADTLSGGDGNDNLKGGADVDTLNGDAGIDTLDGGAGADTLNGGDGNDVLRGGTEADLLNGDAGADQLFGDAGDDELNGGAGADQLNGGVGADTLRGGEDGDTYVVDNVGDVVEDAGTTGVDVVEASVSYTASAGIERLYLTGNAAINATGSADANVLRGNAVANTLSGLDGSDTLQGNAGADTLLGGAGRDFLDGNAGADQLTGGLDADLFIFGVDAIGSQDTIADFSRAQGDRVDLRLIDGSAATVLTFVGTGAFTGGGVSSVRYELQGSDALVTADLNGDGVFNAGDFSVLLSGVSTLANSDFAL